MQRIDLDPIDVLSDYNEECYSLKELGRKYGCSYSAIRNFIIREDPNYKHNKKREFQTFKNLKFYKTKKGYYRNRHINKYLHRYTWELKNGLIPDGYEIHHIDCDKSNNSIDNLEMLPKNKHLNYHANKWRKK